MQKLVTSVQEAIQSNTRLRRFKIKANLSRKQLVLTGIVPSYHDKQMAGEVAIGIISKVEGEKPSIGNHLVVP